MRSVWQGEKLTRWTFPTLLETVPTVVHFTNGVVEQEAFYLSILYKASPVKLG